jgi:hypothetical protein
MRIRLGIVVIFMSMLIACSRPVEEAVFQLPKSDRSVVIKRRRAHATLPEYSRNVILRVGAREVAETPLFLDSGGYSRVNVYQIDESTFLFRDAEASYSVGGESTSISRDEKRRKLGTFVGSFDVDASGKWRFIPSVERGELPTEFSGG